jgi:hypothetical protein
MYPGAIACDVDDLARALRQHAAARGTTEPEDAREIHHQHLVPIVIRVLVSVGAADDSGVVDEDIDTPQCIGGVGDQPSGRIALGEIRGQCHGANTAGRRELSCGIGLEVTSGVKGNISAGFSQRASHGCAETS